MAIKTFDLTPLLINGLRPYEDDMLSERYLLEAYGVRATSDGLVSAPTVYNPFLPMTMAHPFPQLLQSGTSRFLFTQTQIYYINAVYAKTLVPTYQLAALSGDGSINTSLTQAITAGASWHLASTGSYFVAVNGNCMVFSTPNACYTTTSPLAGTVCEFNERIFFGSTTNLISAAYAAKYASFSVKNTLPIVGANNAIAWTSVGYDNLLWLFWPWMMTRDAFLRVVERQESNSVPLWNIANILCIKPLARGIVAYGDTGIAFLEQEGNMFRVRELANFGITSRSAVGGDKNGHIFVTSDGRLGTIDNNLTITAPDRFYQEFIDDMLASDVTISKVHRDYVISGGAHSYMYSIKGDGKGALTELPYLCNTVMLESDGTWLSPNQALTNSLSLTTGIIRLGEEPATVHTIELTCDDPTDYTLNMNFRMHPSEVFRAAPVQTFRHTGEAYPHLFAQEIMLNITAGSYTDRQIQKLTMKVGGRWFDRQSTGGLENAPDDYASRRQSAY